MVPGVFRITNFHIPNIEFRQSAAGLWQRIYFAYSNERNNPVLDIRLAQQRYFPENCGSSNGFSPSTLYDDSGYDIIRNKANDKQKYCFAVITFSLGWL